MSQPLVHTVATKQLLFRAVSLTRKGLGTKTGDPKRSVLSPK
jgi:hypothetical protein